MYAISAADVQLLPDEDAEEAHDPKDDAQHQAGRDLPAQHAKGIPESDLTDGHCPDDDGRSLAAGVPTTGYNKRDEQGEHNGFADFPFEPAHGGCRQHLSEEEDDQPA